MKNKAPPSAKSGIRQRVVRCFRNNNKSCKPLLGITANGVQLKQKYRLCQSIEIRNTAKTCKPL